MIQSPPVLKLDSGNRGFVFTASLLSCHQSLPNDHVLMLAIKQSVEGLGYCQVGSGRSAPVHIKGLLNSGMPWSLLDHSGVV
jgi:hypothetical protein